MSGLINLVKNTGLDLLITIAISVFLVIAPINIAQSAGYKSDDDIKSGGVPHGGYVTTSDLCKSCHALHGATGEFRLLRANEAADACDYCHGQSGIVDTERVWLDSEGHGTSQTTGFLQAPDDTTLSTFPVSEWGCTSCHSVHDNDTIILGGEGFTRSKLLRKEPNASKQYPLTFYDSEDASQSVSQWCTNCHGANFGAYSTTKTVAGESRWGHDVSSAGYKDETSPTPWADVDSFDGINDGPKCSQCHTSSGAPAGITRKFPHAGGSGKKMLKAGTELDKLDDFCTGSPCHYIPSLP